MCGCEPSFVCTRCAGDLRQDYRLLLELDPGDVEREQRERVYMVAGVAREPSITRGTV